MAKHSQGVLQGKLTKLAAYPDKLKALMKDMPEDVKDKARKHLKTVNKLRGKG